MTSEHPDYLIPQLHQLTSPELCREVINKLNHLIDNRDKIDALKGYSLRELVTRRNLIHKHKRHLTKEST